jgi:hypothetical protein
MCRQLVLGASTGRSAPSLDSRLSSRRLSSTRSPCRILCVHTATKLPRRTRTCRLVVTCQCHTRTMRTGPPPPPSRLLAEVHVFTACDRYFAQEAEEAARARAPAAVSARAKDASRRPAPAAGGPTSAAPLVANSRSRLVYLWTLSLPDPRAWPVLQSAKVPLHVVRVPLAGSAASAIGLRPCARGARSSRRLGPGRSGSGSGCQSTGRSSERGGPGLAAHSPTAKDTGAARGDHDLAPTICIRTLGYASRPECVCCWPRLSVGCFVLLRRGTEATVPKCLA